GNLGHIEFVKDLSGIKLRCDHSFNILNSLTLSQLRDVGVLGATLSSELNLKQLEGMSDVGLIGKEVIIYGRLPLMVSEYCPVGSIEGSKKQDKVCNDAACKANRFLKDRMGAEFPALRDNIDCRSTLLNSSALFVPDVVNKLKESGMEFLRMNVWNESPERINDLLVMFNDLAENGDRNYHKYNSFISKMQEEGFSKGHFFKGV
ncbi:MAG: U32 family peptidase, partial [Bacillota bacterium]|nr:U32 family peptidase [Bacillota bacterium]